MLILQRLRSIDDPYILPATEAFPGDPSALPFSRCLVLLFALSSTLHYVCSGEYTIRPTVKHTRTRTHTHNTGDPPLYDPTQRQTHKTHTHTHTLHTHNTHNTLNTGDPPFYDPTQRHTHTHTHTHYTHTKYTQTQVIHRYTIRV